MNEKQLLILEKKLKEEHKHLEHVMDVSFFETYNIHSSEVRKNYINLINASCYQGGQGFAVEVPGMKRYHHIVLKPELYDICVPTPIVIDAFAVIGETVFIANEQHVEYWGN